MKNLKIVFTVLTTSCIISQQASAMAAVYNPPAVNSQVCPVQMFQNVCPVVLHQTDSMADVSCSPVVEEEPSCFVHQIESVELNVETEQSPSEGDSTLKSQQLESDQQTENDQNVNMDGGVVCVDRDSSVNKIIDYLANNEEIKSLSFAAAKTVELLEFEEITSSEIQSFLSLAGFDLEQEWNNLLERAGINELVREESLKTKLLPENFVDSANELGQRIEQAYDFAARTIESEQKALFGLRSLFFKSSINALSSQAEDLISLTKKSKFRMIVRAADIKNERGQVGVDWKNSEEPTSLSVPSVLRSIGKVVAKYLSSEHLSQVCSEDRETLFDLPSGSVFIQRMNVEKVGAETSDLQDIIKMHYHKNRHNFVKYVFGMLVKENHESMFEALTYEAEEAFKSKYVEIVDAGVSLFVDLLSKGYQPAFSIAHAAAKEAFNSASYYVKLSGLRLLKALVSYNYKPAFDDAELAARKVYEVGDGVLNCHSYEALSSRIPFLGLLPAPSLQRIICREARDLIIDLEKKQYAR